MDLKKVQHPEHIKIHRLPALRSHTTFTPLRPLSQSSVRSVICAIVFITPPSFLVNVVTLILVVGDVFVAAARSILTFSHLVSFGTVLGVVDLPAQAEVLPALVGSLAVAHLQGHGAVVTLVCAQLLVVDGPPRPRSSHTSLEQGQHFTEPSGS